METPPGIWPGLVGLTLYHSYLTIDLTTFELFASNATALEIRP